MLRNLTKILCESLYYSDDHVISPSAIESFTEVVGLYDSKYSLSLSDSRFSFLYSALAYSYIKQDNRLYDSCIYLLIDFFKTYSHYDFFFAESDGLSCVVEEEAVNDFFELLQEVTYFEHSQFFREVIIKTDMIGKFYPIAKKEVGLYNLDWILDKVKSKKRNKLSFGKEDVLKIILYKSCDSLIQILKKIEPESAEAFLVGVIKGNWFTPIEFKHEFLQEFYAIEGKKYSYLASHLRNRKPQQNYFQYAISSYDYFKRIAFLQSEKVKIELYDENICVFDAIRNYTNISHLVHKHLDQIEMFFSVSDEFCLLVSFNYAHEYAQILSLNTPMQDIINELMSRKAFEIVLDKTTIPTISPLVHAGLIKVNFHPYN